MKKSIVSLFMITMFFLLLSCDFDAISDLIDKANTKSKLSDENKKLKNLKYGQEDREIQKGEEEL